MAEPLPPVFPQEIGDDERSRQVCLAIAQGGLAGILAATVKHLPAESHTRAEAIGYGLAALSVIATDLLQSYACLYGQQVTAKHREFMGFQVQESINNLIALIEQRELGQN